MPDSVAYPPGAHLHCGGLLSQGRTAALERVCNADELICSKSCLQPQPGQAGLR